VKFNDPIFITEDADMTVQVYPEVVVVDEASPTEVLFVSDAALGAANKYIVQSGAYQNYQLTFTADNLRKEGQGTGWNASNDRVFPIYEDNTSPEIEVTYGLGSSKKFFADRRPDPKSDAEIEHIAPPMFFADSINVRPGQMVTMEAIDDIALYDFAVIFTNEEATQTASDWRSNLPGILSDGDTIDMPMGLDFKYWRTDPEGHLNVYFTGKDEEHKNEQDKPTKTLDEIFSGDDVYEKVLYTDIYPGVNPDPTVAAGFFEIDEDFERYENYTWSGVRNVLEITDANKLNVAKQEEYFTMKRTTSPLEIKMPTLPGTYWVWLVARDRSAQDSWLFDYENERVNLEPDTGLPEIYDQNVLYHQNNYFTPVDDPYNLEAIAGYYENSESESDAPMVVLLRVKVGDQCMNIQRLDIHEPCLVSYPDEDDQGNEIWYAHSYNVLQPGGTGKVAEFSPGENPIYLPRDMYPVFKKQEKDWDEGSRFGVKANDKTMDENSWDATETYFYGSREATLNTDDTFEAVPVVGGNSSTKFRVKTHSHGVFKLEFELLDTAIWDEEQYYSTDFEILDTKEINFDENSDPSDGKGKDGYWEWELDLKDHFGIVEKYGSIVVKAHGCDNCYGQWHWPIFVDTKGPEIKMFATSDATPQSEESIDYFDHLEIAHLVSDTNSYCCWTPVNDWVAFQVKDLGGLMFEYNKDYYHSELVKTEVRDDRIDRSMDLCDDNDGDICGEYVGHSLQLWDTAGRLVGSHFHHESPNKVAINKPENYIYYGFPGTYPNITKIPSPSATPVSSLKYLTEEVEEYEDLQFAGKFHDYYTNEDWGSYNGQFFKVDPTRIATVAFFNNIKLDWAAYPGQKTEITFEIRDELGNNGAETFRVQNTELPTFDASVNATNTDCREATITVTATTTIEEIEKLYISEMAATITKVKDVKPSKENEPSSYSTTTTFKASEFLMPAFATERKFKVEVDTTGGKRLTKIDTVVATYAGATVTVDVNPSGVIRDISQELQDAGHNTLAAQLYPSIEEGYYIKGLRSDATVVTVNFTANDDNVDKYYISYDATRAIATDTSLEILSNSVGATMVATSSTEVISTADIEENSTFGNIYAGIAGLDCPDSSPTWDASETIRIWYQNLNEYIVSVAASPSNATLNVTEIVVELQSDLLYEGLDDLKDIFTLERASDGVELTIGGASACNNILGTDTDWKTITTESSATRNQKFWFKVGNFNLGSPRATGDPIPLEKTENGITCKMWDFWAPAIGNYKEVE
jgi:hypothetical protein